MQTTLRVYVNSDDALLVWTADALDPALRGFGVQRELQAADGSSATEWIDNFAAPGQQPYQQGVHQPSDQWPFRAFTWTDHSVNQGDAVRYRAVPVLWGGQPGESAPDETLASDWSPQRTIGYPDDARYRGYFNRGFVISQFVSRYLEKNYPHAKNRIAALKSFKADLGEAENTMRDFLGGEVRDRLLALLDELVAGDGQAYAALFELADEELLGRLVQLGPRAHLVLANGSVKQEKDPSTGEKEPLEQARTHDENAAARQKLLDAQVDVEQHNRFVAPGALAHNKFLVIADSAGIAQQVWTGSTNWTTTGLCTQLNNALLVGDGAVADVYLQQWKALRKAGSSHPSDLTDSNSTPATVGPDTPGQLRTSVHFTRERKDVDLTALEAIVNGAQEGVLFLMFMPGLSGTLGAVESLKSKRPDLVIRGVVSELPKGYADERTGDTTTLKVHLVGAAPGATAVTHTVDVVQPEGHAHVAAYWAEETTHAQFLSGIGYAIIHSKVLVVDPFSDDPTVVTGSHNFSKSASEQNDENFVVVRGDKVLAEAYAVNVDSAWRHYANRIASPHPDLKGLPYLEALLVDRRADEHFWRLS
jgi:hypothetical protein